MIYVVFENNGQDISNYREGIAYATTSKRKAIRELKRLTFGDIRVYKGDILLRVIEKEEI